MSTNYLDMLNKLKFSADVGDKQKTNTADPNILVLYRAQFADKNSDYEIRVRLLFDMDRGDPNPVVRNWHSFKSGKTGQWVQSDCADGRCPICNATFTVWQTEDPILRDKLKSGRFMRSDSWYINCYVIDNPVEPTQNGTVKILKMNKPILDVFKRATSGRDAKRFGSNIFRLDSEGNTLVISVKDVRGGGSRYPQFTETYFADAEDSAEDVADLTTKETDAIYAKTFNLGTYFKKPTVDEATKFAVEHVYPAFPEVFGETGDQPVRSTPAKKHVVHEEPVVEDDPKIRRVPAHEADALVDEEKDDEPEFASEYDPEEEAPPPPPTATFKKRASSDEEVDNLLKTYGVKAI